MKRGIILIATLTLATLLVGCELYNRSENKPPQPNPNEVEFNATYLIGDY